MRDPSIHIRRSHLKEVLESEGIDTSHINSIMQKALKHSIRNRVVIAANAATRKKISRTVNADKDTMDSFNLVYQTVLREHNIKALPIKASDSTYITFKEVAQHAYEFCEAIDMLDNLTEGYKLYMKIGVELLGRKYSLYRLKGSRDRIFTWYTNHSELALNKDKEKTDLMYRAWQKVLLKYFNQNIEVTDVTKYIHFMYAQQDADFIGAKYDDWMTAQFEKWAFLGIIPEFSQLHGENAALNYQKYIATDNKKYDNDSEREYFKAIKDKKEIRLKKDQRKGSDN